MLESLDLVSDIFSKIASTKNGSTGRKYKKKNYFWLFLTPWKSICRNLILGWKYYERLTGREHISYFIPLDFMDIWNSQKIFNLTPTDLNHIWNGWSKKVKILNFFILQRGWAMDKFSCIFWDIPCDVIRWFWLEWPIWWSRDLS